MNNLLLSLNTCSINKSEALYLQTVGGFFFRSYQTFLLITRTDVRILFLGYSRGEQDER